MELVRRASQKKMDYSKRVLSVTSTNDETVNVADKDEEAKKVSFLVHARLWSLFIDSYLAVYNFKRNPK